MKRKKQQCRISVLQDTSFLFLTFVFAVARRVLALLDEDLCCCVQSNRLCLRHQEEHDKLLAHDAQRFVFPVATSYG